MKSFFTEIQLTSEKKVYIGETEVLVNVSKNTLKTMS